MNPALTPDEVQDVVRQIRTVSLADSVRAVLSVAQLREVSA